MASSPVSDLSILKQGWTFLKHHPLWVSALGALSMALGALAPTLQLHTGLPDTPLVELALASASHLPMEMYFIPWLLIALDSEVLDHPQNRRAEWKENFESRWLRAFGARLLLHAAIFVGALVFIIPGLLILGIFAWVPMRVLLRGDSLRTAAKTSASIMAQHWPRALFLTCAILTVALSASLLLELAANLWAPAPSLWTRIVHPGLWILNFLKGLVSLWASTSFLALYHRLEAPKPAEA